MDLAIKIEELTENEAQPSANCAHERQDEEDEPYIKRRLYTCEVVTMYNLARLVRNLNTRAQCIAFAEQQGLILTNRECKIHRKPMRIDLTANKTMGAFVCSQGTCRARSRVSRSTGTWFEKTGLQLAHIFYLMYAFAHLWSYDKVILEDILKDDKHTCLSRATISEWFSYCREVVVIYYLQNQNIKGKIGGPGKVVQIDESQFGKRKYSKGREIDGQWVLGMIEDGSEDLRLEICPGNQRSADVLLPLIQKHVKEGTTIYTDCWEAYNCLAENNYIHKNVNTRDPDNPLVGHEGSHTQRIEAQWRVVKRFFYTKNYNNAEIFGDSIVEYMWRRTILKRKQDPFIELIKAIKHVYEP